MVFRLLMSYSRQKHSMHSKHKQCFVTFVALFVAIKHMNVHKDTLHLNECAHELFTRLILGCRVMPSLQKLHGQFFFPYWKHNSNIASVGWKCIWTPRQMRSQLEPGVNKPGCNETILEEHVRANWTHKNPSVVHEVICVRGQVLEVCILSNACVSPSKYSSVILCSLRRIQGFTGKIRCSWQIKYNLISV